MHVWSDGSDGVGYITLYLCVNYLPRKFNKYKGYTVHSTNITIENKDGGK